MSFDGALHEIALQVRALTARRSERLAVVTVGVPQEFCSPCIERELAQCLQALTETSPAIELTPSSSGALELLSLEFTWQP